jgi:hypothetical protein
LGVLRWSWRVGYYTYSAPAPTATPFSLDEEPDYPPRCRLPRAASRGLVLVKWWLLAIPQYAIVSVFAAARLHRHQSGNMWADAF